LDKAPRLFIRQLLLLAACSSFFIQTAQAQDNYTIKPYTPGDGLVSADILSLLQDTKNYLWVGHSAGVSRYDGYEFVNFLSAGELRLGKTYCIAEDYLHNIWIGAENGLFYYKDGRLCPIAFDNRSRPVYALVFDEKKNLWIGSSEGPSYFSASEWQQALSSYQLSLHKNILPAWQQFHAKTTQAPFLSVGKDGTAYFGQGYAVFRYFNGQVDSTWKSANQHDPIRSIIAVNKDTVYICSSYSGVQVIENGVYRKTTAKRGASNALIQKNGRLYYYCALGVYEVNHRSLEIKQLFPFSDQQWEWGSSLLLDNENNFWVGTHEQLCYARRNFFTSLRQPSYGFDELYSVTKLRNGTLLCGSNRGKLFARHNDSSSFNAWQSVFPLAPVTDIYEEPDGAIWFTSAYQGISLYENNKLRRFTVDDGLRDNTNFMFFKTSKGELFAGGDNGVSAIIKDKSGQVHFNNYSYRTGSTDYIIVNCGLEKPSGRLVFGSNRGLLQLEKDTLVPATIKNSTRRNYNITDMRTDAHGNVWISTIGDGILICHFENDSLQLSEQLNPGNGLPSLLWMRLLIDSNNITWAAGYNGVTRIERTGKKEYFIASYGRMHGFISQLFHTVKMFAEKKDRIWVATSSGLMKFDPSSVTHSVYPSLQLTGITINNRPNDKTPDSQPAAMPVAGQSLPYDSNSINFHYTGIYFSDPASVIYAYRLIGLDTNWINTGNNRSVSFQHLPPGSYRFEVKAASGTNQWSSEESHAFIIEPPFWQRWWFMAVLILLAIAGILGAAKIYINHIQRREDEKARVQQLITKAASERQQAQLEALQNKQKATEARLQSMRLQMNPHFLFNALNSIQQMILAGDETIATRCLSKFSKLLRRILIHSDKEKITLREELETLRLYVDLESFRFRDRFEYFITCENSIDQDDARIPTLLIQPFVENAIWHGLMHKEGVRRLLVHFKEENETLICTIEDNGIGRQASQAIKENSLHDQKHTGKGIAVATERLRVFGENSGHTSQLEIIDLKTDQGLPAGTRVIVKFPA
jgi:ligand-binding sensor domain-containing protein